MTEETQENTETSSAESGIDPKAYNEIKSDMLKYKHQLKEMEQQRQQWEEEKKMLETKKLEEGNQYKTLYEKALEENRSLKTTVDKVKDSWVKNEKLREIERVAVSNGLRPQATKLLQSLAAETDDVIVEVTNTGRTQVVGVDQYIDGLKQEYGEALFVDGKQPNINNNLPNSQVQTKEWSPSDILKLQKEDPAKYQQVMLERLQKRG